MRSEDVKSVSWMGHFLWASAEETRRSTSETLGAVALMDLNDERIAERAANALLKRASLEGLRAHGLAIQDPFFRLSAEERLILAALHRGRWSYERIARALEISVDSVAELAWGARLHLAYRPGMTAPFAHATGSPHQSFRCPEYHPARPWTQKFLDDQLQGQEKVFLQTHLVQCTTCSQALSRSRVIYSTADKLLPSLHPEVDRTIRTLDRTLLQSQAVKSPVALTFWEGLDLFLERENAKRVLAGVAVLFALLIFFK